MAYSVDEWGISKDLSPEFAGEASSIRRRQKVIDAMLAKGLKPPEGRMVGRVFVPSSPWEGLNSVAQAGLSMYMGKKTDEDLTALGKAQREDVVKEIARVRGIGEGVPGTVPEQMKEPANEAEGMPMPAAPNVGAVAANPQRMFDEAMLSPHEQVQNFGKIKFEAGENAKNRAEDRAARLQTKLWELEARASDVRLSVDQRRDAAEQADTTKRLLGELNATVMREGTASREATAAAAAASRNPPAPVPILDSDGNAHLVIPGVYQAGTELKPGTLGYVGPSVRMAETQKVKNAAELALELQQRNAKSDLEVVYARARAEMDRAGMVSAETAAKLEQAQRQYESVSGNQASVAATAARGQNIVAATAAAGQGVTARGQDIVAATAAAGQGVTARGQDLTAAASAADRDLAWKRHITVDAKTAFGAGETAILESQKRAHALEMFRLSEKAKSDDTTLNANLRLEAQKNAQDAAAELQKFRQDFEADQNRIYKLTAEQQKLAKDRLPPAAVTDLAKHNGAIALAERVEALIKKVPSAVGAQGYLPEPILQRLGPEGAKARAAITDLTSSIMTARSGTAVTASEMERLQRFLPQVTDRTDIVQTKLKQLVEAYHVIIKSHVKTWASAGYNVPDGLAQGGDPAKGGLPPGFKVVP